MNFIGNLKYSFRSIWKNKLISLLNLCGLTLGLTVGSLLLLFVIQEKTVDRHIPHVDQIYSIDYQHSSSIAHNTVQLIKREVQGLGEVTYCHEEWSFQKFLAVDEKQYKVNGMITADSCFFRVFPFQTIYGNAQEGLTRSNQMVITRSLSEKIFGDENPVGKIISCNTTYLPNELVEITAVIEDFPPNSTWNFEAILSLPTNYHISWYEGNMHHWGSQNYKGFLRIKEAIAPELVSDRLQNMNLDQVPDEYKESMKIAIKPYLDLYFNDSISFMRHGNYLTVAMISFIALLILILSSLNYINIITAQSSKRLKQIGIFKMMGSKRLAVIKLLGTEAFILLCIASVCTILASYFLLPVYNRLTVTAYSYSDLFSGQYFIFLSTIAFTMFLITGALPGFILSKAPIGQWSQKNTTKKRKGSLRSSLLIFQFTIATSLLIAIFTITKQMKLIENQNIGYDKDKVIYAYTNEEIVKQGEAFENTLSQLPGVEDFTFSESVIFDNKQNWGRSMLNEGKQQTAVFSKLSVSPNYFSFFGIELQEGQGFSTGSEQNNEYIFNQTAINKFGIEQIEKARITHSNPDYGRIVGIVNDYNFESLHVPIRAAGFMCSNEIERVAYIKLQGKKWSDINHTLTQIETLWSQFSPSFPLEYQFLDHGLNKLYKKDKQFGNMVFYASLVSLILCCLGLIGLTFFTVEQRTKEIGIRKVNGAQEIEILSLLNKGFVIQVTIAFLIAAPISYYAMSRWLEGFAYRTELSWWIFALAGLIALTVGLLTVSWQSWRAATRNPVEALRYE